MERGIQTKKYLHYGPREHEQKGRIKISSVACDFIVMQPCAN